MKYSLFAICVVLSYSADANIDIREEHLGAQGANPSLVIDLNNYRGTAEELLEGEIKSHLLLFLSKNSGDYDDQIEMAEKVAKDYKGQLTFLSIDTAQEDPDLQNLVENNADGESTPFLRIMHKSTNGFIRTFITYKPTDSSKSITEHNIRSFIDDFMAGHLKDQLQSEEIPNDWDANPVKVLVAKNFDEVVKNNTEKHVLVRFYATWSGHCKYLAPIWEKLGEEFADDPNVMVAKINIIANEIEDIKITGLPTILCFTKGDNRVVNYYGPRTVESLKKFAESGCTWTEHGEL